MKIYDLPCFDSHKSFYGKAKIIEKDNGDVVLQSYNTEVCRVTSGGAFVCGPGGVLQRAAISILSLTSSGLREAGKRGGIGSRWNWKGRCKYGLY